jgi:hypothetical protein
MTPEVLRRVTGEVYGMVQILLSLIVFTAALVLLVNSWKAEKKLFAATALVVVLTAAVIFAVLLHQRLTPAAQLDPAMIVVELGEARPSETGVRLSGHLRNLSDQRVAAVRLHVTALLCVEDACEPQAEDKVDVLIQIPPNGAYPFSAVARLTGLRGRQDLRWQIEPVRVTTY